MEQSNNTHQDGSNNDNKERKILPMTLKEFEEHARRHVHPVAWRYVSYNAGGLTGKMARRYLDRLKLRPRILRDVSKLDPSVTLCDGTTLPFPLIIAPTAFHRLFHPHGELATARAAARLGVLYSYNVFLASVTLDTLVKDPIANAGPKWLHVYFLKGKACVQKLVERGEKTGMFSAIIVTCDHPHNRVKDYIAPDIMTYFADLGLGDQGLNPNAVEDDGTPFHSEDVVMDTSLTWKDLEWLKSITKLPIIAKGILDEEDAICAVRCGASGIVVSNHGGRQIDGAVPAIEALPHIISALKKESLSVDVYVDSGVRSGVDVVKALSLGAKAVLIGRPVLWGLAVGGQEGLERMLNCLKDEFTNDLMSLGNPKASDLGHHVFWNYKQKALL